MVHDTGYFSSGGINLYYVAGVPSNNESLGTGVIFVHAANGNRFGPHRMFVELSQKLNQNGISSFRFDLSGCGDSEGKNSEDDIDTHKRDIFSAIQYFHKKYSMKKIYLCGISRGAYLCFLLLTENTLPVDGAILLSCPASSTKAAIRSFSSGLKEYFYKLLDVHLLYKLFSGKVNLKYILKSLLKTITLGKRYLKKSQCDKQSNTRIPMLYIYGQNDPICPDSKGYYCSYCENTGYPYQVDIIPDANHSYFHYLWKEKVFSIIITWLKETNKQRGLHDILGE